MQKETESTDTVLEKRRENIKKFLLPPGKSLLQLEILSSDK